MRVTSTKRKALKLYGNRRSRRYEPQFHCGASHRTVLAYYCHAIAACRNCLVPSLGYSSFKSSQVNQTEVNIRTRALIHTPHATSRGLDIPWGCLSSVTCRQIGFHNSSLPKAGTHAASKSWKLRASRSHILPSPIHTRPQNCNLVCATVDPAYCAIMNVT